MRAKTKRTLGVALGLGLALAVAIAAIVIPGYQSLRPALDSATVWVANGGSGQVAAANTQIEQLQDVTRVSRGAFSVEQDGDEVLLVDATNGTLRTLEPGVGELGTAVPIPPTANVQVRDGAVMVADPSTGDVVVTTVQAVREGQPLGEPILELGQGALAVLGDSKLFAVSPGLARVIVYDLERESASDSHKAPMSPTDPQLQLTAVGDTWVLFDETSGTISTESWSRQLHFDGVRLQQPGDRSGSVVFATDGGVVRATMNASAEEILIAGMAGAPAAPLVVDGCVYALWHDGTAWNGCAEDGLVDLQEFTGESEVEIQARASAVIATDPQHGLNWSLFGEGRLINDWLEPQEEQLPEGEGQQEVTPDAEEEIAQRPPVAEDDEFGARPGRVTVLPVTRNDSDPNNDPLVISEVTGHEGATVTADGQAIRLDLGGDASGIISLSYRLTDGNGGEDTADVAVSVRSESQNAAPEQLSDTSLVMQTGGTESIDALADWVDPDGDPLTLVSVSATEPDRATARPDGRLEFHDGGAGGVRTYTVTVSDGIERTEGLVTVSTTAKPQITAEPISVKATVGQTLEIEPLLSARGGDGELRLHNVELPRDMQGDIAYEAGIVRVTPTEEADVLFPYVVTDGSDTQQGTIRLDVLPAETASSPPLPLPRAIALPPLGSTSLDLSSATADPAGGSLVVTEVAAENSALRVSLVDLGIVQIELTAPLEEPATVTYTLSNGTATATGVLEVSESEPSAQTPIARDDAVRAAAGQAVTIYPLENDEHPDLGPVTLLPDLVSEPSDGVMFTRGSSIVFLAPESAGTYEGVYEVEGPDGQRATATVTVTVGATGGSTNEAPEAPKLHARVLAGESVDITVPLAGSDPNGDPVQLLGPSTTPQLGTLSRVDATTFRYTAGAYSGGTDEIQYLIADDRGAQSTGSLTIAVAPRTGVDARPRAVGDTAEMIPGTSLAVDVLANDTDAANLSLTVVDAEVTSGDATAEINNNAVVVHAGDTEGEVGVMYVVENSFGERSTAWLLVDVHEEAVPPAPVANDIDVPLRQVLARDRVTVQPLQVASVTDGRNDLLSVEVAGGGDDVEIQSDGSLSVPVRDNAREFAYVVTRSDTGAAAYGIVRVPGTTDSLPQLRDDIDPIEVVSGETISININDFIVAATGQPVWITDASNVRATQGERVIRDAETIEYTPTSGYHGPANISLEVTDGESPGDQAGRVGLVVLPITVVASDDTPPTLLGTTFTLEPGEVRTIDLLRITEDPANRPNQLSYSVDEQDAQGTVSLEQVGSELTMSVAPGAQPGTSSTASVQVDSGSIEGNAGTLVFQIATSTRPLAQPVADTIEIRRGSSETLQPLANDEATNPFPGEPLRIDALEFSTTGLHAEVGADNAVTVWVSGDAETQLAQVRYRTRDAQDRTVWGTIRVRIQDAPDRPAAPVQVTDRFERNTLFVNVTPPNANNSELTALYLLDQFGDRHDCTLSGECTIGNLDPGVNLRFAAVAVNEIGESQPSQQSAPMQVDALPNPVQNLRAQPTSTPGTMRLTWDAASVPSGGTAVTGYIVRITGPGVDVQRQTNGSTRALNVADLAAGETYTVRVAATNSAGVNSDLWRYSDPPLGMTAVGRPGTVTVGVTDYEPGDSVSVSWASPASGGATPMLYRAEVIDADERDDYRCRSAGNGQPQGSSQRRATDLALESGRENVVAVTADNGWFCSVSFSESLTGTPGAVSTGGAATVVARQDFADVRLTTLPPLQPGARLQVKLQQGNNETDWLPVAHNSFVSASGLDYGSPVTVQVRQYVVEANRNLYGPARTMGTVVPFDLRASLGTTGSECVAGEALDIRLPGNSVEAVSSADVEVLVNGIWEPWEDHDEPLPPLTQRVSVTTTVEYQGNVYQNPRAIEFSCGQ